MNDEISLAKFLSRYGLMQGKDLKKVRHSDVKKLFPRFKRSSFEEISVNPSLLYSGRVVMVNDGFDSIPYYVPSPKSDEIKEEEPMLFSRKEIKKRTIDDRVYNYTDMSIYELTCLLTRRFNSCRNQSCARRELNRRGHTKKK